MSKRNSDRAPSDKICHVTTLDDIDKSPPQNHLTLALITDKVRVTDLWVSTIVKSPAFKLVAIYCIDKASAKFSLDYLKNPTGKKVEGDNQCIDIFYDIDNDGEDYQCKISTSQSPSAEINHNLDTLLERDDINAILIYLPSDNNNHIVTSRVIKKGGKHVFNAGLPSYDKIKFHDLVTMYHDRNMKNGADLSTWHILDVVTFEAAFIRGKAMLSDIGTIIGSQLCASGCLPGSLVRHNQFYNVSADGSLNPYILSYSTLLREFFGNIKLINGITTNSKSTFEKYEAHSDVGCFNGVFIFDSNVSVCATILFIPSFDKFHFSIWGSKGNVQIDWIPAENRYQVHRYLHHYEHPTNHPSTGFFDSIQNWVNSSIESKMISTLHRSNSSDVLINLTISSIIVNSDGSDLILR